MIIIESVPESILNHGIHQGTVIHPVAVAGLRNRIGSHGHVFHAAGHYHIRISGHDHLSRLIHTVQTGTADYVHGHCRHLNGKSRLDGCLTGHILAQACLDDTAHVHLIYIFRLYTCPVQGFLDHDGPQLRGRSGAQRASHGTDGGTACSG